MQLGLAGTLGEATIEDISLSGVRCTTAQSVPVMTQVALELVLAGPVGGERRLACQGVVVRSRALDSGPAGANEPAGAEYETAIFFTTMTDGDRLFLDDYLRMLAGSSGDPGGRTN